MDVSYQNSQSWMQASTYPNANDILQSRLGLSKKNLILNIRRI